MAPSNNNNNNNPNDTLKDFIARNPAARYTFDSERDAPQSEICREGRDRECILLQMTSKQLFAAMQENGFFCALPMDPTRTHMECTPIPKS
ncbi:hypothetical protein BC834DRAFT_966266 [Gloeopeniophorella convolvens]|nr:hypothetical protein BC834DRAFT_966266 [Gloeopeniophorella convolvens]